MVAWVRMASELAQRLAGTSLEVRIAAGLSLSDLAASRDEQALSLEDLLRYCVYQALPDANAIDHDEAVAELVCRESCGATVGWPMPGMALPHARSVRSLGDKLVLCACRFAFPLRWPEDSGWGDGHILGSPIKILWILLYAPDLGGGLHLHMLERCGCLAAEVLRHALEDQRRLPPILTLPDKEVRQFVHGLSSERLLEGVYKCSDEDFVAAVREGLSDLPFASIHVQEM